MYRVTVTADFDTEAEAEKAKADMNEAIGKNNGDLQYDEIEDLEDEGRVRPDGPETEFGGLIGQQPY